MTTVKKFAQVVLVFVGMVLVGCAGGQGGAAAPAGDAAATGEETGLSGTVVFWTWTADQIQEYIIPAFNEIHPDITVETLNLGSGELRTRLMATLAAGSGAPDIAQIQGDDIVQFIHNGGLSDITDYMAPIQGNFPEFQISNATDSEGRIFAIPIDSGPAGMFYRADLFEAAGIVQPPTTWDEFFEAGEQLMAQGIYIHRMPDAGDMELLRMFVEQQGGSYFAEDGSPTLNTPELRNAIELQLRMLESGVTMNVRNWTPAHDAEMQGDQLASHIGAAWYMNAFLNQWPDASENWQIAPMPQFEPGANSSANNGGSVLAIPEQSQNRDAAWAFMEFYCASVEGRLIATNTMGELASYLPVFEAEEMRNMTVRFFGDQPVFSFFADQLENIPDSFIITPAFSEVSGEVGTMLTEIMHGNIEIDQALENLQAAAESIVLRY